MHWTIENIRRRLARPQSPVIWWPRPVVELMEGRCYPSFSGSVSGLPTATTNLNYTLNATTTGSVSASSETFNFGDTYSVTQSSPSNPQAENHAYSAAGTETPNASITPSGGSAFTAPFTLDAGFNAQSVSGKVVTNSYGNVGSGNNGTAMTLDLSGGPGTNPSYDDILVAAPYHSTSGGAEEWVVSAFESDGSPEDTFGGAGGNGTKVISMSGVTMYAPTGITVDGAGNIDVVGNTSGGWAAAQVSSDGSQIGWTNPGFVTSGSASAVTTDGNGDVVVAGTTTLMAVIRLKFGSGLIDTTFNSGSVKTVQFISGQPSGGAAVVQEGFGNSDFIVGGYTCEATSGKVDFALAALSTSGSLDTGFNSTGKATANFGAVLCTTTHSLDELYALASDNTNSRIIAAGTTSWDNNVAIAAFTSAGALDTSNFNSPYGLEAYGVGTSATAYGIALQGDGKIVVAGTATGATNMSGTGNDFALVRVSSSGVPDTTFGSSGIAATDFSGSGFSTGYDVAVGVAVDLDDTIVAAGQTGSTSSGGYIAVAKYLPSNQVTVSNPRLSPMLVAATTVSLAQAWAPSASTAGTDPTSSANPGETGSLFQSLEAMPG